jgi:hypothetical protein
MSEDATVVAKLTEVKLYLECTMVVVDKSQPWLKASNNHYLTDKSAEGGEVNASDESDDSSSGVKVLLNSEGVICAEKLVDTDMDR